MRLLVTGGSGQLGYELARQAVQNQMTVLAATRRALDVTSQASVDATVSAFAPDLIVNAAAYTAVDRAETERDLAFAVNAQGPENVARAAVTSGIPIIHVSTDYVFDGSKSSPYLESDPTSPIGAYGESKLAGEEAVRGISPRHVILRTAWVYGVHGANFVKTMLRVGAERSELSVVGDQVGCPTFAADLASAILQICRKIDDAPDNPDHFGLFNCTGSGATSWHGFATRIFALAADQFDPVPTVRIITTAEFPTPARRPANSRLDSSKLQDIYNIRLREWDDALQAMLNTLHADRQERAIS